MNKTGILGTALDLISTRSGRVLIIGHKSRRFKGRCLDIAIRFLLALTSAAASAAELPAPVLQGLRTAGIPLSSVSVLVQEAGTATSSLALRAEAPMNPASVMKLVTTFAALELLGPAYRWKTEVYADGARRDDVLEGNLVLRGRGDPKLNYESFWMLLRSLRSRGLR